VKLCRVGRVIDHELPARGAAVGIENLRKDIVRAAVAIDPHHHIPAD
jgi:hypothetical protein